MAPRRRIPLAIPTTEPLPNSLRLPANNHDVFRTLSRLSRSSLLSLAMQWCQDENLDECKPYVNDGGEEGGADDAYTAAETVDEVLEIYKEELPRRKGTKREVVDRILEGDWRHGISLKQLAMAETQYILDHPQALRWTAFRFAHVGASESDTDGVAQKRFQLPRFHAQSFLLRLQRNIAPLAKVHYHVHRPPAYPLTLIRIYLHTTPYNTQRSFTATCSANSTTESPKSIFLAFPDATPFVYISLTSTAGSQAPFGAETKSLQRFFVAAIPKSLSSDTDADVHYELRGTSLSARSLDAMLALRGPGRSNAAAGGWSIFADADANARFDATPLDFRATFSPTPETEPGRDTDKENATAKNALKRPFQHARPAASLDARKRARLKAVAAGRFGASARGDDGKGLQRFDVRIEDPFPARPVPSATASAGSAKGGVREPQRPQEADEEWTPSVRLSFQGAHVFAGIRALVECGVLDGERLPGWMTGEAGVSVGTVRDGRIVPADEAEGG